MQKSGIHTMCEWTQVWSESRAYLIKLWWLAHVQIYGLVYGTSRVSGRQEGKYDIVQKRDKIWTDSSWNEIFTVGRDINLKSIIHTQLLLYLPIEYQGKKSNFKNKFLKLPWRDTVRTTQQYCCNIAYICMTCTTLYCTFTGNLFAGLKVLR